MTAIDTSGTSRRPVRPTRRIVLGGAAALAMGAAARHARADAIDALAREAAAEPPILFYESSPQDQLDQVTGAFERRFPGVRVRGVRLIGGSEIGSRIIQETQAGARTADVAAGGKEGLLQLIARGLVGEADWVGLGVPRPLVANPSVVVTGATPLVVMVNTRAVPEAEVPRSWDDLLAPRWVGQIGTWASSGLLANLGGVWGEARTVDYVERFARQRPLLYRSLFTLSQAVASGELPVGVGSHHAALPALRAGAPLRLSFLDPTPVSSICSFFVKATRSPSAAKLLILWQTSEEGAQIYESITGRGVHLGRATRTAEMLRGLQLAEYELADLDKLVALRIRLTEILQSGGKDAG